MPALSAKEHDPHVKAYFQHLVDNGKLPIQAVCAVMRKLLHAIHGMLKHNQTFDNSRFYAIPISENSWLKIIEKGLILNRVSTDYMTLESNRANNWACFKEAQPHDLRLKAQQSRY